LWLGLEGDLIVVLLGAGGRLALQDLGNDEALVEEGLHGLVLRADDVEVSEQEERPVVAEGSVGSRAQIFGDPMNLLDALLQLVPAIGAVVEVDGTDVEREPARLETG